MQDFSQGRQAPSNPRMTAAPDENEDASAEWGIWQEWKEWKEWQEWKAWKEQGVGRGRDQPLSREPTLAKQSRREEEAVALPERPQQEEQRRADRKAQKRKEEADQLRAKEQERATLEQERIRQEEEDERNSSEQARLREEQERRLEVERSPRRQAERIHAERSAEGAEQPEADTREVCKRCKERCLICVWPTEGRKKACHACEATRQKCEREGEERQTRKRKRVHEEGEDARPSRRGPPSRSHGQVSEAGEEQPERRLLEQLIVAVEDGAALQQKQHEEVLTVLNGLQGTLKALLGVARMLVDQRVEDLEDRVKVEQDIDGV